MATTEHATTGHEDGNRTTTTTRGPAPTGPRPYEGVWRFTAPAVDGSVPQSRRAVKDLLKRQGVPIDADTAYAVLLIVSELVTNAVRHAALLSPELAVEVAVGPEWIRVAVEDEHPYRPRALEADDARTGGRGLLLVREITREAGGQCDVEHTASGGKIVWAALPLRVPAGVPPLPEPPDPDPVTLLPGTPAPPGPA
ncbi:ATP-binding protein [Streptomyces solincola]|uniref:ATP-binding protein n=1 Tax=Streptomyces solincola TaxID=2100817 RepID=A0A2S9PTR2_9ACTN|nr:ATP-binding protein [Streptomyces solincola]